MAFPLLNCNIHHTHPHITSYPYDPITGWKAPRNSTQLVYPQGLNTSASDDEINTSFRPTPNYAALAEAAAGSNVGWENTLDNSGIWIKGLRVETVREFREALQYANLRVAQGGKGMLIEVSM